MLDSERPSRSQSEEDDEIAKHRPKKKIKEANYKRICSSVEVILHVVNNNEFNAATTFISAPSNESGYSAPDTATKLKDRTCVGTFAGHPVGLVRTSPGRESHDELKQAIKEFPRAQYIVGVGVCYGFDREKTKLGDVVISDQITDLGDYRVNDDSSITPRGDMIGMTNSIKGIFCDNPREVEDFCVSNTQRTAAYRVGNIVSGPNLVDDRRLRNQIKIAVQPVPAVGGEMEGKELIRLQKDGLIKGVIIIKAVVDYADGTKNKTWQFIGAKAAFHYVHCKMSERQGMVCV